jgi:hypothetical protein
MVFYSDNPFLGWDGTIRSTPQNSGSFVFMATYRFGGGEEQMKRGYYFDQVIMPAQN